MWYPEEASVGSSVPGQSLSHVYEFGNLPDSEFGCCRIFQSIAGYPALPDIRYIPSSKRPLRQVLAIITATSSNGHINRWWRHCVNSDVIAAISIYKQETAADNGYLQWRATLWHNMRWLMTATSNLWQWLCLKEILFSTVGYYWCLSDCVFDACIKDIRCWRFVTSDLWFKLASN